MSTYAESAGIAFLADQLDGGRTVLAERATELLQRRECLRRARRGHESCHRPALTGDDDHFPGLGAFKPYLGAGVNYTRFSSVNFTPAVVAALQPSIDKNSFGFAVQAGMDYEVSPNLYVNFDVKKVQIRTDVSSAGTKIGEFRIDPWLVGIGVGRRF